MDPFQDQPHLTPNPSAFCLAHLLERAPYMDSTPLYPSSCQALADEQNILGAWSIKMGGEAEKHNLQQG